MPSPADFSLDPVFRPPDARAPSTEAIGRLARDIVLLFGQPPAICLSAAILIDQGRHDDAMRLLVGEGEE
jgi:hypothetical protein